MLCVACWARLVAGGAADAGPAPQDVLEDVEGLVESEPGVGGGYAQATIYHVLGVVAGFYDFDRGLDDGPLMSPVPVLCGSA